MNFKSQTPFLLTLAMGAAINSASAQTLPTPSIVGNYRAASKTDPQVKMAAGFALKTQKSIVKPTLLSIESAEKQLVAGMNFRMMLKLKSGGKVRFAKAVVYRDLQGKYSLSSWVLSTPARMTVKK